MPRTCRLLPADLVSSLGRVATPAHPDVQELRRRRHVPSDPMRLSDYLRAGFVLADLQGRDLESVVHEVAAGAATAGVGDERLIAERLLDRERAHTTSLGAGLAVPHATVPGLQGPVVGVAYARAPVVYGPPGSQPVRLFFVLLSPPGHEREHVKLLARICRLGRREDLFERLDEATTPEEIIRVVEAMADEEV